MKHEFNTRKCVMDNHKVRCEVSHSSRLPTLLFTKIWQIPEDICFLSVGTHQISSLSHISQHSGLSLDTYFISGELVQTKTRRNSRENLICQSSNRCENLRGHVLCGQHESIKETSRKNRFIVKQNMYIYGLT